MSAPPFHVYLVSPSRKLHFRVKNVSRTCSPRRLLQHLGALVKREGRAIPYDQARLTRGDAFDITLKGLTLAGLAAERGLVLDDDAFTITYYSNED